MQKESSARLQSLDVSKGILIVLVVAAHIFQKSYFWKFAYNFHMEAFFIISGMLICHTASYQKPWKKILSSKIRTMLIPLCFFELWGVARDLVLNGAQQSWKDFLYNTFTLHFNNGVLWFLFVLFFSELLFIAIRKTVKQRWLLILLSVGLLLASLVLPRSTKPLSYLCLILRTVFFLAIGFCFKDYLLKTNLWAIIVSVAVLIVLVLTIGAIDYPSASVTKLPYFLAGSLFGTYFVLQLGKVPWLHIMWVVGRETLIIYGTHSFYYVVFGSILGITDFKTVSLFLGLADFAMVAAAEVVTVYLLNRILPFAVGKRRPVSRKPDQPSIE